MKTAPENRRSFRFAPQPDKEEGFTLVELLVVILIIGILAAIAIPAFLNQRAAAFDSTVKSDLTNAVKQLALDEINGEAKTPGSFGVGKTTATIASLPAAAGQFLAAGGTAAEKFVLSDGVIMNVSFNADGEACLTAYHPDSNFTFANPETYDTGNGGLGKTGGACAKTPEGGNPEIEVPESAKSDAAYLGSTSNPMAGDWNEDYSVMYAEAYVAVAFDISEVAEEDRPAMKDAIKAFTATSPDGVLKSTRNVNESTPSYHAGHWPSVENRAPANTFVMTTWATFDVPMTEIMEASNNGTTITRTLVLTYKNVAGQDVSVPATVVLSN